MNNIRELLKQSCDSEQEYHLRLTFYGSLNGTSEPTDSGSICSMLGDLAQETMVGDYSLKALSEGQFLYGKDYSGYDGDSFKGYLL